MSFGLKNAGATYQRLMHKIFENQIGRNVEVYVNQIGRNVEVYVDDMVVKSETFDQHLQYLTEIFGQLRLYKIRLNRAKCVFGVEGEKFLWFMLTHRGIEANPDKCVAISSMRSPTNLKEVQRLLGRLTSLSRFLPRMTKKIRPILEVLRKVNRFKWDNRCKEAFNEIKTVVSSTPIFEKHKTRCSINLFTSLVEHFTT